MSEYIVDMGTSSYQSNSGLLCADVSQLREEIVRCRDCKHYRDRKGAILPSTVCQRLGYYNFKVEPDNFCAWGEKEDKCQ